MSDTDTSSRGHRTPLHDAANYNQIDKAKLLLSDDEVDVNARDKTGRTPLHLAANYNKIEITELLLGHAEIDVNARDENGYTPLHVAANYDKLDITKLLLSHGNININVKDEKGYTPLHVAANFNKTEITKLLLGHASIDVNLGDDTGRRPLHVAANYNKIAITKLLLGHNKVVVATKTEKGFTPLHIAAFYDNFEVVDVLLKMKQDSQFITAQNDNGDTAFHIAIARYSYNAVKTFINHNDPGFHVPDKNGNPPLLFLITRFPELVKIALDKTLKIKKEKPSDNDRSSCLYSDMENARILKASIDFSILNEVVIKEYVPSNSMPLMGTGNSDSITMIQLPGIPESKVLSSFRPMLHMAKLMRKELLVHPTVEKFLCKKWYGFGIKYFKFVMLMYMVYLVCLTIHGLTQIHPNIMNNGVWYISRLENSSYNCTDHPDDHGCVTAGKSKICVITGYLVLIMAIIRLCWEFGELCSKVFCPKYRGYFQGFRLYFADMHNWLELMLYSCSIYFVSNVFYPSKIIVEDKWIAGLISMALGYLNFLMILRLLVMWNIGLQIIMLVRILQTFVSGILFLLVFFIITFVLFFNMLISQTETYGKINSNSFFKTISMWTSGIAYEEYYRKEGVFNPSPSVSFITFLVFIILVHILCMNLATGLAFEDVAQVRRDAAAEINALRITYVYKFLKVHKLLCKHRNLFGPFSETNFFTSHHEGEEKFDVIQYNLCQFKIDEIAPFLSEVKSVRKM